MLHCCSRQQGGKNSTTIQPWPPGTLLQDDGRQEQLNKIANEIVNEYMVRQLKEGHNKIPPALRRLAQTIFPTNGAAELLEGLLPALWRQATAVILSCRRRPLGLSDPAEPGGLLGPSGRDLDAKGDSFHESMAMPCTCLVMNESS